MRYSHRSTYRTPPWVRSVLTGPADPSSLAAGGRLLFSDVSEENVEERVLRLDDYMSVPSPDPVDTSAGGADRDA